MAYKVVHYINQFFAGLGGEEKADIAPEVREGKVGPGMGLAGLLSPDAEIVATFICGDNYFANNMEKVCQEVVDCCKKYKADGLIAGPAFNAGRYGTACASVCAAVEKELGIPTVTALYKENPGVDLYRKQITIVETDNSAAGMKKALPAIAKVAKKLLKKEPLGPAAEEGIFEKGVRQNMMYDRPGAERAVDMLIKKLKKEPFTTEYPMPVFDRVEPRPPVKDMKKAKIAIVTSGGIVPFGNPDHIAASSAQNFGEYDITGVTDLKKGEYQTAHGGYDQTYANQDPDRVLPVDVLRDMVKAGEIGELFEHFYTTVGNGTSVANAKKFGTEIGKKLKDAQVQAVILTST